MHPALLALCTDTIQHAAYQSQDAYGNPVHGPPVARQARVEYVARRFLTAQGQERVSRAIAYVDGSVIIDMRDAITLTDGTTPSIQALEVWTDPLTQMVDYRKLLF
jgi:hypothetical protein